MVCVTDQNNETTSQNRADKLPKSWDPKAVEADLYQAG